MPLIRKPGTDLVTPSRPQDVLEKLRASSADERWSAARQLGRQSGHAALLTEALTVETDPRVREALFTGLAADGGQEATLAMLSFIRSPDSALRTGALDALATVPETIAAHLESLLGDDDPDVRILSCDLARRLPTTLASRHLVTLLEREVVPNVCGAAVEVLSEVGDESALPALRSCALRFAGESFLIYAIQLAIERVGEKGGPVPPPAA